MNKAILCGTIAACLASSAAAGDTAERASFKRLQQEISFQNSGGTTRMVLPSALSAVLVVYTGCTLQSAGMEFTDKDAGIALAPEFGKDCSAAREQARSQALPLLQAEGLVTPKYQESIFAPIVRRN